MLIINGIIATVIGVRTTMIVYNKLINKCQIRVKEN